MTTPNAERPGSPPEPLEDRPAPSSEVACIVPQGADTDREDFSPYADPWAQLAAGRRSA